MSSSRLFAVAGKLEAGVPSYPVKLLFDGGMLDSACCVVCCTGGRGELGIPDGFRLLPSREYFRRVRTR
jgi:hypothetical protein